MAHRPSAQGTSKHPDTRQTWGWYRKWTLSPAVLHPPLRLEDVMPRTLPRTQSSRTAPKHWVSGFAVSHHGARSVWRPLEATPARRPYANIGLHSPGSPENIPPVSSAPVASCKLLLRQQLLKQAPLVSTQADHLEGQKTDRLTWQALSNGKD